MRRSQLWTITPERVLRARVAHKLTQAQMARKFGVATRTIIRWEQTGLPIRYGRHPITYESWERFEGIRLAVLAVLAVNDGDLPTLAALNCFRTQS